jgi:DNA invertase Pin-like site-specific DNA recombinase
MKATYIRVSTLEQNTDRQTTETNGVIFTDKVSGAVLFEERPAGKKLLQTIAEGTITELEVHSIDRLGRNTIDILTTIQKITALGCNVISKKEGLSMMIDGKENPMAKMMIGILSTLSEFELQRIKERQKEGIAAAKDKGTYKTNSRPTGTTETTEQFLAKKKVQNIIKYLKQNHSIRAAAKLSGASVSLVQKVQKLTS